MLENINTEKTDRIFKTFLKVLINIPGETFKSFKRSTMYFQENTLTTSPVWLRSKTTHLNEENKWKIKTLLQNEVIVKENQGT